MQFYVAIVFSAAAVATTVLQFWPKITINREQPFLFPLLTMAAIDIVALLAPQPVNLFYKGAILLGLLVSTLAVVFLYVPKTPEYVSAAHFLVVHFLYFVGFTSANKVAVPSPIVLLIVAYSLLIFWFVRDALRERWGALIAYIALMALMVWAASEVWVQHDQLWGWAVFSGAILLVISGSVQLIDRTRSRVRWADVIMAAAFFAGQLLIAWSVWGISLPRA